MVGEVQLINGFECDTLCDKMKRQGGIVTMNLCALYPQDWDLYMPL